MKTAFELINKYNLINQKDRIGVACSGGIDSMSLLHFLFTNKDLFNIEVYAINVDHSIRENSKFDSEFVEKYCKENKIKLYKFKVDCLSIAKKDKLGIEESARKARYKVFDTLLDKKVVDKIAIAHHSQDQVETIMLNLFRGSGLSGITGMEPIRDNYIRPFLTTKKQDILSYANMNNIPFVEDETNFDSEYSRNLLRNKILPLVKQNWPNFETNILNFANICKQDDSYINSCIDFDNIIIEENIAKIPLYYFSYNISIINRVILFALKKLKASKDIETKHLLLIKDLANESNNGVKIHLPNNITVTKEYNVITILVKKEKQIFHAIPFFTGKKEITKNIILSIKKVNKPNFDNGKLYACLDFDTKDLVIRTRQDGDIFQKFGSGEKKLKNYFIDKKIPSRLRDEIPLIAKDNEILVIPSYEISEKVKVTNDSKNIYEISLISNKLS